MTDTRRDGQIDQLCDRLLSSAATGGGWPYYRGQSPRLEPTAWAILALSSLPHPQKGAAVDAGWNWLRSLQRQDGLLVEPGLPVNYGWNGLVLLAAESVSGTAGDARFPPRLTDGLVAVKGRKLEGGRSTIRQDSSLQAWSWVENTFSWIEPTAYCLIALKKRRSTEPTALARIVEAEAVLIDRVCDGGGWNYGNANVLSQDLRPYVPTTALGLMAMRDKGPHPAVQQSLAWLTEHALSEKSSMALSLAAVCLRVFDRPIAHVLDALSTQEPKTSFLANLHLIASALYALTLEEHGAPAFTTVRPS